MQHTLFVDAKVEGLIVSNPCEFTARRAAQAAGFDAHLVKPVNVDQLEPVIKGLTVNKALARGTASSDLVARQTARPPHTIVADLLEVSRVPGG